MLRIFIFLLSVVILYSCSSGGSSSSSGEVSSVSSPEDPNIEVPSWLPPGPGNKKTIHYWVLIRTIMASGMMWSVGFIFDIRTSLRSGPHWNKLSGQYHQLC